MFLQVHGIKDCMVKTIRTDGEGSLTEPAIFRQTIASHGYLLQKTAIDTSLQNELAERPVHKTLGGITRCLLYSAAMPIYFWADAIVYATYIYNRLYHGSVTDVPYNLWTGKRADIRHLRAFGSKVIVKRSGQRPTNGNPHFYDGRFLRFGGTDKKLGDFDETMQREKLHVTARSMSFTTTLQFLVHREQHNKSWATWHHLFWIALNHQKRISNFYMGQTYHYRIHPSTRLTRCLRSLIGRINGIQQHSPPFNTNRHRQHRSRFKSYHPANKNKRKSSTHGWIPIVSTPTQPQCG